MADRDKNEERQGERRPRSWEERAMGPTDQLRQRERERRGEDWRDDAWGGQSYGWRPGPGFVDHAYEPRPTSDRRSDAQDLGGYGRGGGGDEPGYGGFSGGGATTGYHGHDQEDRGGSFENAPPGFGGYGTSGGNAGASESTGGGTSGLGAANAGWLGAGRGQGFWGDGPYAGVGPRGYKRSDDNIREDACELLTRNSHVDASGIQLQVEEGEVTLEGSVASRREKRLAEQIVESISGVRDVHNRLRVEERQ